MVGGEHESRKTEDAVYRFRSKLAGRQIHFHGRYLLIFIGFEMSYAWGN